MKRNTLKRVTALALASTMAISLASCGVKNKNAGNTTGGEKTKLSIVVGSHASWPYQASWPIWKWMEEATNTELQIQAIPGADLPTKIPLILASPSSLPDLIHLYDLATVNQNALSGPFVAISDNLDKMPNYVKFMDSLPEAERKELKAQRTSGDGKIYYPPVYGTQKVMNLRTWMYRKDIFEKHNLKPPTTLDEMYTTSKKLKQLYPNSYPLCFRNGLGQIDIMGPMFKNNFSYGVYYDFKEKKWCWGAQDSETMKSIINFFSKMASENLIPPDFITINSKSWEELVSTDRGFMMPEYLVRIDFFNEPNRKNNPKYTWAVMAPPKGDGPNAQAKVAKVNMDPTGYVVCNTGNKAKMDKSLSFVDWMYTPEGAELCSWGKEGESYKVENGKKKFILNPGETVQTKYGIGTYGVYQVSTSFVEGYSEEQKEQGDIAYKYTEDNVNPRLWLPMNAEEMRVYNELFTAINTYTEEQVSKFMLKQIPMSQWDSFQKGLKDMGVDRLLAAYTSAYNRVMGK